MPEKKKSREEIDFEEAAAEFEERAQAFRNELGLPEGDYGFYKNNQNNTWTVRGPHGVMGQVSEEEAQLLAVVIEKGYCRICKSQLVLTSEFAEVLQLLLICKHCRALHRISEGELCLFQN